MNKNRLGIKNPQNLLPFRVVYWDGVQEKYGTPNINKFLLTFKTKSALARVRRDPSLGFAEGYMKGEIEVNFAGGYDLRDVVRAFYASKFTLAAVVRMLPGLLKRLFKYVFWFNTKKLAGKNAQAHYDLPPQVYENMLDEGKNYSCAMPISRRSLLSEAQANKNRIICEKLRPQPGDVILDIGCGWCGLDNYIIDNYEGVTVVGITLSIEQCNAANWQMLKKQNSQTSADKRLRVYLTDYRNLPKMFSAGTFTKIVNVGMFEHVGHNRWQKFCDLCCSLLKPGGTLVLQTITKEHWGLPDSFTMKHVFPGGETPYDKSVFKCLERAGFNISLIHYFGSYYAWTLDKWRTDFLANWEDKIKSYIEFMPPEEFKKLWDLYLSGAQISFESNNINVMQVTAHKGTPVERSQI